MDSNPCNSCLEATRSTLDLVKILNHNWSACDHCAQQPVMEVLREQFWKRRPLWWVVDGESIVPPQIVDYFRKHPPVSP